MIPEATREAGRTAGLVTTLGFAVAAACQPCRSCDYHGSAMTAAAHYADAGHQQVGDTHALRTLEAAGLRE
jgi:hypothetical protein